MTIREAEENSRARTPPNAAGLRESIAPTMSEAQARAAEYLRRAVAIGDRESPEYLAIMRQIYGDKAALASMSEQNQRAVRSYVEPPKIAAAPVAPAAPPPPPPRPAPAPQPAPARPAPPPEPPAPEPPVWKEVWKWLRNLPAPLVSWTIIFALYSWLAPSWMKPWQQSPAIQQAAPVASAAPPAPPPKPTAYVDCQDRQTYALPKHTIPSPVGCGWVAAPGYVVLRTYQGRFEHHTYHGGIITLEEYRKGVPHWADPAYEFYYNGCAGLMDTAQMQEACWKKPGEY